MILSKYLLLTARTRQVFLKPQLWHQLSKSSLTRTSPIIIMHNLPKQFSTDDKPQTRAQRLKKAVAEYGSTVIVFHVGISLISLGSFYLLVSTGLDMENLLATLKLDQWVKSDNGVVTNAGTFAVAYAVHKVFAPARMAITLGSVPFIVKYLRTKGVLKK